MEASSVLSASPSLSSYSTSKLAEIAARVVDELGPDSDPFCCDAVDFCRATTERPRSPGDETERAERGSTQFGNGDVGEAGGEGGEEEEEEEFEFAFVCGGPVLSPIPADEIFSNGQIRPVYPVFNRDLLLNGVSGREKGHDDSKKTTKLRLPLKKLLSEDREWYNSSSSSSESDELDRLAPGSYCAWRPKSSRDHSSAAAAAAAATKRCEKSSSTGSSKRWRLKNLLLNRSSSDVKDPHLLAAPCKKRDNKMGDSKRVVAVAEDDDGVVIPAPDGRPADKDAQDKRKPFLHHGADLVGFFSNANLKLHPF